MKKMFFCFCVLFAFGMSAFAAEQKPVLVTLKCDYKSKSWAYVKQLRQTITSTGNGGSWIFTLDTANKKMFEPEHGWASDIDNIVVTDKLFEFSSSSDFDTRTMEDKYTIDRMTGAFTKLGKDYTKASKETHYYEAHGYCVPYSGAVEKRKF